MPDSIDKYLPLQAINDLISFSGGEAVETFTGFQIDSLPLMKALPVTIFYTALFYGGAYFLMQRRSL